MTVSVCENPAVAYTPSDELLAALKAWEEAEAAQKAALVVLHAAIAAEVAKPSKSADVARAVHYHPGHVARIARAHGVPGDPKYIPPRRPADS